MLSTKAETLVNDLCDDYIAIGPWRLADEEHDIERVGKELRDMMPWLESTT